MTLIKRNDINSLKMWVDPPEEIVNAGYRVINSDKFVYIYVGSGWVKEREANREDYKTIPELID